MIRFDQQLFFFGVVVVRNKNPVYTDMVWKRKQGCRVSVNIQERMELEIKRHL